jgi:hypothetical protein
MMFVIKENNIIPGLPFKEFLCDKKEYMTYIKSSGGFIPNLIEIDEQEHKLYLKCFMNSDLNDDITVDVFSDNKLCIKNKSTYNEQIVQLDKKINVKDIRTYVLENYLIITIDKQ